MASLLRHACRGREVEAMTESEFAACILADALEEAGADNQEVLWHLLSRRGPVFAVAEHSTWP
jgi:hypothetical protein